MPVEDIQRGRSHQRVAERVLLVEEARVRPLHDRVPGAPLVDDQADLAIRIVGVHRRALLDDQVLHPQPFVDQFIPLIDSVLRRRTGGTAVVVRGEAMDVAEVPVVFT